MSYLHLLTISVTSKEPLDLQYLRNVISAAVASNLDVKVTEMISQSYSIQELSDE